MFRDEDEVESAPPAAEVETAAQEPPQPLFLERRQTTDRRQGERRGLDSLRTEYQRSLLANVEDIEEPYRSRFEMPFGLKPSRIALILVALLAGGIAAYLAVSREPAPAPIVAVPVETVAPAMTQILVAKSNIAVGQRLTPDMVEYQDWPDTALRPDYLTKAGDADPARDLTGRMVRATLYAGEPIRQEKLAAATGGLLSSILDKGMRGVSVQITAESASGGFVLPDDHVDVILTHQGSEGRQELVTILRNVRVLAINANLGAPDGSAQTADNSGKGFSDQAIATLALTEAQSQVIIRASTMGKLSLTLRSNADTAGAETPEEQAANAAIRISSPFWAR